MKDSDKYKALTYEELFELLEEQGLQPMVCDTPVPFYENGVRCGIPADVGDIMMNYAALPGGLVRQERVFFCRALGDSMTGAEIYEGDWLKVEPECIPQEGDYVLVLVDGESTVKTYFRDEDDVIWLVPQNEKYPLIRLKESQNFIFQGVIREVLRTLPRSSHNKALQLIRKAKAAEQQEQEIGEYQVARAIREIAPMVTMGRQWYAVYRALADVNALEEDDFEGFCNMVEEEVPNHQHKPVRAEVQRMAILSFAKPVVLWKENNAPVSGKRFKEYLRIAQRVLELLGEK